MCREREKERKEEEGPECAKEPTQRVHVLLEVGAGGEPAPRCFITNCVSFFKSCLRRTLGLGKLSHSNECIRVYGTFYVCRKGLQTRTPALKWLLMRSLRAMAVPSRLLFKRSYSPQVRGSRSLLSAAQHSDKAAHHLEATPLVFTTSRQLL
jgi:hypothetical protein